MPLIDFGIDSLVAVEIRAWFLQELAVDLPVLKILGGASVADLVDYSMQKLHDVLSITAQTSTNTPPLATSATSVPYSQEVSNQSSRTLESALSSDCVEDSASSSGDIAEDLESPLVEVDDGLNQALVNEKGRGTRVENATHK
jgi:Phosphopantetheine attachment site